MTSYTVKPRGVIWNLKSRKGYPCHATKVDPLNTTLEDMKVEDSIEIPVSKKDIAVEIKILRNAVDRYKAKRLDTNFSVMKLSDNSGVGIWRTK